MRGESGAVARVETVELRVPVERERSTARTTESRRRRIASRVRRTIGRAIASPSWAVAFPPLAVVLIPLAVLVEMSRVCLDVHEPGDVLIGQVIALLTGLPILFG